LGDHLQLGISLNIFVLFVFFVDQMIFLGLWDDGGTASNIPPSHSILVFSCRLGLIDIE